MHDIREPRDAQLRANLARASIGTELLIEARVPAIALAFQTPIAPKGQCRHYRAFSTIVAWIVHGSFSCALVCAVLSFNLVSCILYLVSDVRLQFGSLQM